MGREVRGPDDFLYNEIIQVEAEIREAAKNLTCEAVNLQMNNRLFKNHLGNKYMYLNPAEARRRKADNRFSFFSESDVDKCLRALFDSSYAIHHMAKNSVLLDEDDVFVEEIDVGENVGFVFDEFDRIKRTGLVAIACKVLPWGVRHPITGLPFLIEEIQLFVDDSSDWFMEPEEENERNLREEMDAYKNFVQLSLFDLIVN